jgi:hypothetical protein
MQLGLSFDTTQFIMGALHEALACLWHNVDVERAVATSFPRIGGYQVWLQALC